MKYLRKFDSVADMNAAIANSTIGFLGLAYNNGNPVIGKTSGVDYTIPFYIEDVSGSANTVSIIKGTKEWPMEGAPTLTIEKSTDGTTWESMGTTSTTAITATIPANGKLYLRCSANTWCDTDNPYCNTINMTGNCNVGGNIMSLLYGSNFTGNETTFPSGSIYTFHHLFMSNTHIINAANLLLPATTLTSHCYDGMFDGCTSLTTTPELPATTLADSCYYGMFQTCTSLTTAPELPATTVTYNCYTRMFSRCTALTTAPTTLPATTLATHCYEMMFIMCTSLTTAPALPATTLDYDCYSMMFQYCTALTTAPELPAATLVSNCYQGMFSGCSNLNYIKCLATDIPASEGTDDWVSEVASTGTFVKHPNASGWIPGNVDGIPSGWTVQEATA